MINFSLEGKVALVTGGAYGIGFAITQALAEAGARVAFNCRSEQHLAQALADYKAKGIDARGYIADVTDESQVKTLVNTIEKELGTLHTVVFCGLMGGLSIILTMVASVKMGPYINIGFSWIPNRIVDFMFGPIVGMIYGGAMDIVKWMAKPDGDFMIIYTFVPMLTGIIVGTLLYKKPVSLVRIIIVQIIIKIFT